MALASGDGVLEALAAAGAAGGGAVVLQGVAVRGDGDPDGHARLVGAHLVPRPAVVPEVELRHHGVLHLHASSPRAHGERNVGALAEQVAGAVEELAVGQRLDAEGEVLAAQVLHRHVAARLTVLGVLPGGGHGSGCQRHGEEESSQGLGERHERFQLLDAG